MLDFSDGCSFKDGRYIIYLYMFVRIHYFFDLCR